LVERIANGHLHQTKEEETAEQKEKYAIKLDSMPDDPKQYAFRQVFINFEY